MPMAIEIVPCRLSHIREAARFLRREEIVECAALNQTPRHLLHHLWKQTPEPRAAIANGRVLAVGGEAAGVIGLISEVWLFTTALVESMPFAFVRALRGELDRILAVRGEIVASVHVSCMRSQRLFEMLGAEFEPSLVSGFLDLRLRGD
jgi:hypothetical protein